MGTAARSPLHVLVAGGGVAALEATLALRKLAEERVTVELVAPEREFTYRPLAVAEPFRVGEVRRFPLAALVEAAGARLRHGVVVGIDPARRIARTEEGDELSYDLLLLAFGARPVEAVPGALTFRGPDDEPALEALLEQALRGEVRRLAFALPGGVAWPLPLYELALLTWSYLTDRGAMGREFTLLTPEEAPLALFGAAASDAAAELLKTRGIDLRLRTSPVSFAAGELHFAPKGRINADRVVALPRLEGIRLPGVPHDPHGFVRTDPYGRVPGLDGVYAAGDLTSFPVKQGGIAAQQADVAAAAISLRAGAPVRQTPFEPVLRGQLLTGIFPRYLRSEPATGASTVSTEPLWWPPAKIADTTSPRSWPRSSDSPRRPRDQPPASQLTSRSGAARRGPATGARAGDRRAPARACGATDQVVRPELTPADRVFLPRGVAAAADELAIVRRTPTMLLWWHGRLV